MSDSLSVIVPVCNAQARLARQVADILEIIPDVAPLPEVVIVDDGSSDSTEEIACELRKTYPQVVVARHDRQQGTAAAVTTGLRHCAGTYVYVQDEHAPLDADQVQRLWHARGRDRVLGEQADCPTFPAILRRNHGLAGSKSAHEPQQPKRPNMLRRLRDLALGE